MGKAAESAASVVAYYTVSDPSAKALERVLPYALAFAIALWPTRRSSSSASR